MSFDGFLAILMGLKDRISGKKESVHMKISDVALNERFILASGESLSNLIELFCALQTMESEVYMHHVNEQKNDFAEWAMHSVGDPELAMQLRSAEDSYSAAVVVGERVRNLLHKK